MKGAAVTGVLGGTFDPVHLGHLEVAERSKACMGLEGLLLMPSAIPPHKSRPHLTPARHRLAMLRLAVKERPGIGISTLELDTGGVCYTIDTLRRLSQGGEAISPIFILGTDSLAEIQTWRDYRDIMREFDLAALDRPGNLLVDIAPRLPSEITASLVLVPDGPSGQRLVQELQPGRGGRIFHLPMAPNSVSSSRIRQLVAAGSSIEALVPPAVGRYIQRNALYRQEDPR
jgi:nicotinate-nucleotide adenylyltransferase